MLAVASADAALTPDVGRCCLRHLCVCGHQGKARARGSVGSTCFVSFRKRCGGNRKKATCRHYLYFVWRHHVLRLTYDSHTRPSPRCHPTASPADHKKDDVCVCVCRFSTAVSSVAFDDRAHMQGCVPGGISYPLDIAGSITDNKLHKCVPEKENDELVRHYDSPRPSFVRPISGVFKDLTPPHVHHHVIHQIEELSYVCMCVYFRSIHSGVCPPFRCSTPLGAAHYIFLRIFSVQRDVSTGVTQEGVNTRAFFFSLFLVIAPLSSCGACFRFLSRQGFSCPPIPR